MKNIKQITTKILYIIFLFLLLFNCPSFPQLSAQSIFNKVSGAIVHIYSVGFNGNIFAQGSGVVIKEKGYLITNFHVFNYAERLAIKKGNNYLSLDTIIGVNINKDIVIFKIDTKSYPSIKLADPRSIQIGQKVVAIGYPLGLDITISEGIISGLRNDIKDDRHLLQFDAAISHGSSGGAVLNSKGELIGISTASYTGGQNLNLAVSVQDIESVDIRAFNNKKIREYLNNSCRGYNAEKSSLFDNAIQYYFKCLNDSINIEIIYDHLGNCYSEKKDVTKAITYWQKSINLNNKYIHPYLSIGKIFIDKKDYSKALDIYKKAFIVDSNNAGIIYNIGVVYYYEKEYNKALDHCLLALKKNSLFADAYSTCGLIYRDIKNFNLAIKYCKKATLIDPSEPIFYINLANIYYKTGKYDLALVNYKKVTELSKNYLIAYEQMGNCYRHQSEFDKAISYYLIAEDLGLKDFSLFNNTGNVYSLQNKYDEAFKLL